MTVRLPVFLISTFVFLASVECSHAQIYQWRDAGGRLHYSNRVERVPPDAKVASPPPLGSSRTLGPARSRRAVVPPMIVPRHEVLEHRATRSGRPAHAMVDAIAGRVTAAGNRNNFTLLVDGRPVLHGRNAIMQQVNGKNGNDARNVLSMSALADPGRTPTSRAPALDLYRVASAGSRGTGSLCGDFRRAFATVGVAVSRDHQVARSLRDIAEDFAKTAARGYRVQDAAAAETKQLRAGPPWPTERIVSRRLSGPLLTRNGSTANTTTLIGTPMEVQLPPWLVYGHIAQLEALSEDTEGFVTALTVALEEIDLAARDAGCW